MPRRSAMVLAAAAVALGPALPAGASAVVRAPAGAAGLAITSGGTWGQAMEVPGTAALNTGGSALVTSVSCASAGDCAAGGVFADSGRSDAFVVGSQNDTWSGAIEVPGTAALNVKGLAQVLSVSCASAGDCTAGGEYRDASRRFQAFVASEVNGTWGTAIEVPGSGSLNAGGTAEIHSVSCPSAGNCAAGGFYIDRFIHHQAFVVVAKNGVWGRAIEVPGTAVLNAGGQAGIFSVSCPSAGNCAAGGTYRDGFGHHQAFVIAERNGTWGRAREIRGTPALNAGGHASLNSVSCTSPGNCAAGGFYRDAAGRFQAFVAGERNGAWGRARQLPGSGALNAGGDARILSMSCASAGSCAAGGFYLDRSGHGQAFVVSERNGTWGKARQVPGTATLNADGNAVTFSVSCGLAGNCAGGGYYLDGFNHAQAFVVNEVNGAWGKAIEVPGSGALNAGGTAMIFSVSCASADHCDAGGRYVDGSGQYQAFVVSEG